MEEHETGPLGAKRLRRLAFSHVSQVFRVFPVFPVFASREEAVAAARSNGGDA